MRWIIDGHNLIPNIPGISLADVDDEDQLIEWIQIFLKSNHDSIELYFDKAAIGRPKTRSLGRLTIIHVDSRSIADQAIIQRCQKLGNSAEHVTVVSSDHVIQNNAHSFRAKVMDSRAFVDFVFKKLSNSRKKPTPSTALSEQEIDEWMNLFRSRPDQKP